MRKVTAPIECPVCHRPPSDALTLQNGAPLRQCPECSLSWWDWPEFDAAHFYDHDYFQSSSEKKGYDDYASLERGIRKTARVRLARIDALQRKFSSRLLSEGRALRMLEIGCGTGCFLDESVRAGWDADGIEISSFAAEQACARGLSVVCGPIDEIDLPKEEYDCVVLWDVIEHLPDPAGAIEIAASALKRGGILALSTGDVTSLCARLCGKRWHLYNLPEHLFFFSPRSLEKILAAAHCRIVERVCETNWVPLAYIAERLAKPLGLSTSAARIARGWTCVVPATLRDVMGIYAVRI